MKDARSWPWILLVVIVFVLVTVSWVMILVYIGFSLDFVFNYLFWPVELVMIILGIAFYWNDRRAKKTRS
jgi:hypothetical protein